MEIVSLTWQILEEPKNFLSSPSFNLYTSRKLVLCTGKLLKIESKLILIHFVSYVEYVFFPFFFFLIQNVVGKIDKENLRIGFRIDPTF